MSATSSPATWRSRRASDDVPDQLRDADPCPRGEHETIARHVDQPRPTKGMDEREGMIGFHLAANVLNRPQRLTVLRLGQQIQDIALQFIERVQPVLRVILVVHGSYGSFATAGGQFALSPRPICMELPKLDDADRLVNEFRYSFRLTLLVLLC